MHTLNAVIYGATIAAAFVFAFWERKLKLQLTDEAVQPVKYVSDLGVLYDLKENLRRENFLSTLPPQAKIKYRVAVGLKFLFLAILFVEVIFLQQTK
jgi:coproporphyrinogen III oxidase